MKVLHIGEYVNGGVATYLKVLIDNSLNSNIEHYLMMSDYKSEKEWKIDDNRIFYYRYKRKIGYIVKAISEIQHHIQKVQPDVIHIHSSWAGALTRVPYLIKKKNVKIIYSPHGWSFLMDISRWKKWVYIWVEKALSNVTDRIINISQYEQKQAVLAGINQNKMVMIYNGVKEKSKRESVFEIKIDEGKINLLFVGRIDRQKGLDILLKVYYKHDFPNIHLYVIGESILDNNQMKSDDKTTYLGWIKNKNIDAYYQICDAVVIPSRWEGFGLVAIEAMRNKKPIIASNRGALPEVVGDAGYIFDFNDQVELKKILNILDKQDLIYKGNKGYERYRKMFTSKDFCLKTIELELREGLR